MQKIKLVNDEPSKQDLRALVNSTSFQGILACKGYPPVGGFLSLPAARMHWVNYTKQTLFIVAAKSRVPFFQVGPDVKPDLLTRSEPAISINLKKFTCIFLPLYLYSLIFMIQFVRLDVEFIFVASVNRSFSIILIKFMMSSNELHLRSVSPRYTFVFVQIRICYLLIKSMGRYLKPPHWRMLIVIWNFPPLLLREL